jgi:hypothetical protein
VTLRAFHAVLVSSSCVSWQEARGQWGEPYGVTVHKKRGVLIMHSFIHHVPPSEGFGGKGG